VVEDSHASDLSTPGLLRGIRVVEVGVFHAGPGASAILGDLGADVVKVEHPSGDPERTYGTLGPIQSPPTDSANWSLLFDVSNRNKRSVCIDLNEASGREVVDRLVASADVFVSNLLPSARTKLSIDYGSISRVNPEIVYLSVTGFGAEGPLAGVGAFDTLGQAMSGMMYLTGNDEPAALSVIMLDQMTAITGSQAVLAALLARANGGGGQEITASLYGSATWLMHANLLATAVSGEVLDFGWNRSSTPVVRSTYRCGDGEWIVGTNIPEEKFWPSFCAALGREELVADPRFATKSTRIEHVSELLAIFDPIFASRPRAEWIPFLRERGLMFAPVNRSIDVLSDPQALANGYVVRFPHRRLGDTVMPGYPVRFSGVPAGIRFSSPDLGEHTDEVLAEAGYTAADIVTLRGTGAIA
jgi:crotonobetainyl-CoA:carnitine CoA-transferase CaiB-like acyl-CoA transferase